MLNGPATRVDVSDKIKSIHSLFPCSGCPNNGVHPSRSIRNTITVTPLIRGLLERNGYNTQN